MKFPLTGEAGCGPARAGFPGRDAGCERERAHPSGCLVHVAGSQAPRGPQSTASQVRRDRQLRTTRDVRVHCTGKKSNTFL